MTNSKRKRLEKQIYNSFNEFELSIWWALKESKRKEIMATLIKKEIKNGTKNL
jgi:hypothetical protein